MNESHSSLRNAGSEIIKEGRIPTNNSLPKRKTIQGIKPEDENSEKSNKINNNNPILTNNSVKDMIENAKNRLDSESNMSIESVDFAKKINTNVKDNKKEMKTDILTKQAIEEVKDNIDLFKMDINKYVQELKKEQEKIELSDVKSEMKVLEENLNKDLKLTQTVNKKDYETIRESFKRFRDETYDLINKIISDNAKKILTLSSEIKAYEDAADEKFERIENKQEEYINCLRLILETTKDKNTQRIVKQFLIDDHAHFEANKQKYLEQFEEEKNKKLKILEEKEKEKLKVKLKVEENELANDKNDINELKLLETQALNRENEILKKREEEILKLYNEKLKSLEEEQYNRRYILERDLRNYQDQMVDKNLINKNQLQPQPQPIVEEKREKRHHHREKNNNPNIIILNPNQPQMPIPYYQQPQPIQQQPQQPIIQQIPVPQYPFYQPQQEAEPIKINKPKRKKRVVEESEEEESEKPKIKKKKKKRIIPSETVTEIEEKKPEVKPEKKIEPVVEEKKKEEIVEPIIEPANEKLENLQRFNDFYKSGNINMIQFIGEILRQPLINTIKSQSLDITKDKFNGNFRNDRDVKEKIHMINLRLKDFFGELNAKMGTENMPMPNRMFLKKLVFQKNFIPFKFFSLFELSRFETLNGFVDNLNENQQKLILVFYTLMKIFIKYYMIDYNFVNQSEKSKLDSISKGNLKIISSLFFHEIIEYFKFCPIVRKIDNMQGLIDSQHAGDSQILQILHSLNNDIITGLPDDDPNTIQYIDINLYKKEELETYLQNNENFGLHEEINNFINNFMVVIKNTNV